MKSLPYLLLLCSTTLAFIGCQTGYSKKGAEMAEDGSNQIAVAVRGSYTQADVAQAVVRALTQREWTVVERTDSKITARLVHRELEANLDISVSPERVVIESDSYRVKGSRREPFVPVRWIEYLKRSIEEQLKLAAIK